MHRVSSALTLLFLALPACTTQHDSTTDVRRFSVQPYGDDFKLSKTRPQPSGHRLSLVSRERFREITVAQGSGLDGFDTIRIFADGSGYAVVGLSESRAVRVPLRLSGQLLDLLVRAIQQDRMGRIKGMYSSGVADGTQGFVELVTSEGRVYCWLDNYFVPVSHTYAFCNQHVWPDVMRRRSAFRIQRHFNLQEEYSRVFHNEA
jgi:hypothetical protein